MTDMQVWAGRATSREAVLSAFDVSDKVVFITGGGGGLGSESGRVLAACGAHVILAEYDREAAERVAAEIAAAGGSAEAVAIDVTDKAQVGEVVAAAHSRHGRIDGLVNGAGVLDWGPALDVAEAAYDQIFDVNVRGTFFACQAVGKRMLEQGEGSIVIASSGAIDSPSAERVSYSMTKAAVAQMMMCLAAEWSPSGVRVNALAPGFFPSRMTSQRWTGGAGEVDEQTKDTVRAERAAEQLLPRRGEPIDQGMAVLYLMSDAARFVTGQIMRANGGLATPW